MGTAASYANEDPLIARVCFDEIRRPVDASDVNTPRGESAKAEIRRIRGLIAARHLSEEAAQAAEARKKAVPLNKEIGKDKYGTIMYSYENEAFYYKEGNIDDLIEAAKARQAAAKWKRKAGQGDMAEINEEIQRLAEKTKRLAEEERKKRQRDSGAMIMWE